MRVGYDEWVDMRMTSVTHQQTASARSTYVVTASMALLWFVVAMLRPGTTIHLGPLVVPLIPTLLAHRGERSLAPTLFGAASAVAVLGLLTATGHLDGPALSPFSTAIEESIVFLGIGIALGFASWLVNRRR